MKLSDFDYHLPKELIAQHPMKPRDHSRLLVLDPSTPSAGSGWKNSGRARKTGHIKHKHFYDLPDYFQAGDVLVLNNSKVMKARLYGRKKDTGGKVEVFLLKKEKTAKGREIWQCLLGGGKRKEDLELEFSRGFFGRVKKRDKDNTWQIEFSLAGEKLMKAVEKIGHIPLPPYIKRSDEEKDASVYQTIYADKKKSGSVAAPTAGLHFTPALMKKLKAKGVQLEYITLHVGLGTFAPVKVDDVKKHKMHAEWAEIGIEAAERIMKAKREGKRIIAAGTTSVRTLESMLGGQVKRAKSGGKEKGGKKEDGGAWTDIFIYPGYKFRIVDVMITNFHLPKSTLLMLVSAFLENKAGKDRGLKMAKQAYQEAIEKKYRFFSYGDAMLVL